VPPTPCAPFPRLCSRPIDLDSQATSGRGPIEPRPSSGLALSQHVQIYGVDRRVRRRLASVADDVKTHRGLTTERVVDAALRAADEGGIEAVSLRRVAVALEVTPMAIYRHVRNKSHLLDLMAERLLEQVDLAPDELATWQDRLRRLLGSYQAVVAAHPAAPLLLSRPFVSPAALLATEALLGILRSAGFDAGQSVRLIEVISGMLLGPAIHRAAWATAERDLPRDADRLQASMEGLSADEFPYLSSAADQFMWSAGAVADLLTIELLVGGLEALTDQPNQPLGVKDGEP
jgi:TetR/AcrR family tetracycline transcriptional repressor